jgi:hypothetical protein
VAIVLVGGGGGTYDVGDPDTASNLCEFKPKGIAVARAETPLAGNVTVDPDSTARTEVTTASWVVVFWRLIGQLISPEDRQLTIWYVVVEVVVVKEESSRRPSSARAVINGVVVAVVVFVAAQILVSVVYHTGTVVSGDGPHEYDLSIARVAPAAAPNANVYSATAANSQSSLSATVEALTCTRKSAT